MKYTFKLIVIIVGFLYAGNLYSQDLAVKSNLLYDATGTMDLGLEIGLGEKTTLDISASINPWDADNFNNEKMMLVLVQPELRYWINERFKGHFFGVHAHYSFYNVSGGNNWLLNSFKSISTLSSLDSKNYRSEGWLAGAGVSYGYNWNFSNRWSLEGDIGLGYAYMDYDKYDSVKCGGLIAPETKHYFGLTKVGLTLVFMINAD